jgi:hypothetical protein
MASIPPVSRVVIGGVDTHKDLHVAAVIDTDDHVLGTQAFSTTRAGYRALLAWMRTFGDVRRIGVEGTGSYGAGLLRHLQQAGIEILEVNRPDRSDRRRRGKDDTLDAENAAHAALAGNRVITPKTRTRSSLPSTATSSKPAPGGSLPRCSGSGLTGRPRESPGESLEPADDGDAASVVVGLRGAEDPGGHLGGLCPVDRAPVAIGVRR